MTTLATVLPALAVLALILVLSDFAQKWFLLRLIREARDEKEREALLAVMANRRR